MGPNQTTNRLPRLLLAVFLLIFLGQGSLWAARKGAMLKVQRSNQTLIEGELIAVRETKLILMDSMSRDLTVDIDEVNLIIIDRKPHTWLGAGLGMVLGGIVGAAVAPSAKVEELWEVPLLPAEEVMSKTGYGLAGALAGGVLGGLIGAAFGSDSQIVQNESGRTRRSVNQAGVQGPS